MIHYPPHPGRAVHEFCMKPLGLNNSDTARILGVSRQRLSDIVRCKTRITPVDAIGFEKAFGGGAGMCGTACSRFTTWYRSGRRARPRQ